MNTSAIIQSSSTLRFSNRSATAPTSALMPPTSFITWNAAKITTRNSDSMISVRPLSEPNTRIGASKPLWIGMPFAPSTRVYAR